MKLLLSNFGTAGKLLPARLSATRALLVRFRPRTVSARSLSFIYSGVKPRLIDAIDRLADLVAKSLVVADVSSAKPRFRLFETTRAYAIERLDESGERKLELVAGITPHEETDLGPPIGNEVW